MIDSIPIALLFSIIAILIFGAIELGYNAGNTHTEQIKKEKEKTASSNAGAILGVLGFILVFTFGIVYSRYDSKKDLVREEANLIRNAWLRSDFLVEQDRKETLNLLKKYLDLRLDAANFKADKIQSSLNELSLIQRQIWNLAVVNARKDLNSDVGALYIESVNEMINQQALRVSIGLQQRIPAAILIMLFILIVLGMFGAGYQTSISNSSRWSWLTPVMILTFSLLVTLIIALDRPNSDIMPVSQQPLEDLRDWMNTGSEITK